MTSTDQQDLLIELGCEELPPKALPALSAAFSKGITDGLSDAGLAFSEAKAYASPRRLAVVIAEVQTQQSDSEQQKLGPNVKAAYDADGNPTPALTGFAKSCGVEPADLQTVETDKGERLAYSFTESGRPTSELLQDIFEQTLKSLPIPKRMRWADRDAEFVRPAHWIVALLGDDVVPLQMFGLTADRTTRGHRFMGEPTNNQAIEIKSPAEYHRQLEHEGKVIADFEARKNIISTMAEAEGLKLGGQAIIDDDLLDEVTALVEWPSPISGSFDKKFLELPKEVPIAVMQDHQKYFPVEDKDGKLLPHFITISNIESKDPAEVAKGNERVVYPRLEDGLFFWNQDRKQQLEDFLPRLDGVTYQREIGSVGDRSRRIADISKQIAALLEQDDTQTLRAATLCKADLVTDMVFEFTELQGTMGRYYAQASGEDAEVAQAIEEHYQPRFAGDNLPETEAGRIVALADKLDALAGIFAIGKKPSGTRDPFGLRRAALGVIRILTECHLDLDLKTLVQIALDIQPVDNPVNKQADKPVDNLSIVLEYLLERMKGLYAEQGIPVEHFQAVIATGNTLPTDIQLRMNALSDFVSLPEAESLAAAHKRIRNILKDIELSTENIKKEQLLEKEEQQLYQSLEAISVKTEQMVGSKDYVGALRQIATLQTPVDAFFNEVMVMADDEQLRQNRLALLTRLDRLFKSVADFSYLT